MTEPLNPLSLPLQGSRLIEASAGTGKTWTLAALMLRLVLGDGGQRPLMPAEILVMTFTKAATRELSDRVRQRLMQAAAAFRGRAEAGDAFLEALLALYPPGEARDAAAFRLSMAAEAMDDAAIHTIDAWCQRMLREHAFDSGCLFDEELQADTRAMQAEAARDYWRQQVYPLDGADLRLALDLWPDVSRLLASVLPLLEKPLPDAAGEGGLGVVITELAARRARALAALKQAWVEKAAQMLAWLSPLWSRKDKPIDGRVLGQANGSRWIQALSDWAAEPAADKLDLGKGEEKLTRAGVLAAIKRGFDLDPPACFSDFEALMAALSQLPPIEPALRLHAAARILERLQTLKARANAFDFADMLNRLDAALDEARHGDSARRLRQRILAQYPAVLVDEFQDTSPMQLRILERLYRIADNEATRVLLLIGDPKQSIYGFRGADIHSYLQARRATAGRQYRLSTNHRSTVPLVAVVNAVFADAEARPGAGAFLFRREGGEGELPFVAVQARGRREQFVSSAGAEPPLRLSLDATLKGMVDAQTQHAALCAERIVAWLNDPQAGFAEPGQAFRRLRPADIAVLVRTGREAVAVRRALQRRDVASVFLSDKESVFRSEEAQDLLRLLRAIAAPRDMRLARSALATALLGLSVDELLQLAGDDESFDERCEVLAALQADWAALGVLAMLRRALHAFNLSARWLAGPASAGGERRLTNLLHLAELLQSASEQLEGEAALIRWLAQQIDELEEGVASTGEEQVLRLESDADLVKVVTVHKSKGLEYPLVLLPFAAHHRAERGGRDAVLFRPDEQGQRQLVMAPDEAQIAAADEDRLRDDLRLLYVALTRAQHALWLGAAALRAGPRTECAWTRSAIGLLLSGSAPATPESMAADLERWAATTPGVVLERAPEHVLQTGLRSRDEGAALRPAPGYSASFDRLWSISSYSALVKEAARAVLPAQTPTLLRDDEPSEAAEASTPLPEAPWHRFPRGAFAGNFLHGLLEWLAGEGFALDSSTPLQQQLLRRCERQGWGHRADDVLAWLRRVCERPLPALGCSLAGLSSARAEMEFWFPSDGLRSAQLDRLCREHVLPGRARPELPARSLRGLLMGFADLVYEQDGRYGVLDHKSNALGTRDADYTPAAMEAAMLEHRYDVQAALYLLALHRLLRARLGAVYAPALHLHGAVFLFLRGVGSPTGGAWYLAPPLALIEALDAMLLKAPA